MSARPSPSRSAITCCTASALPCWLFCRARKPSTTCLAPAASSAAAGAAASARSNAAGSDRPIRRIGLGPSHACGVRTLTPAPSDLDPERLGLRAQALAGLVDVDDEPLVLALADLVDL